MTAKWTAGKQGSWLATTKQVRKMPEETKVFIKDIEELKQFIKMNKKQEDYFDNIVERVISKNSR